MEHPRWWCVGRVSLEFRGVRLVESKQFVRSSGLGEEEALALARAPRSAARLDALCAEASALRDTCFGDTLTFSPKVFLPITTLCRNRCDYCTFRRSPGEDGAHTMSTHEVREVIEAGAKLGVSEALLCLGDKPEKAFASYRRELATRGVESTVDLLEEAALIAREHGLYAHTNAGILSADELARLRPFNASMGLMLENISPRLCEKGMPHYRAPDKRPEVRMAMLEAAGALKIPFTSGLLIGIGETREERMLSLLALRDLHVRYGHIQEIIVQNFRAKPSTAMAAADEPDADDLRETIAWARLVMPTDVTIQAPPNLAFGGVKMLIDAGLNDFGGISPVTPDFINPGHPWPLLSRLREEAHAEGRRLVPRLPLYPAWMTDEWVDAGLLPSLIASQGALSRWWTRFSSAQNSPEPGLHA